MFFFLFLLSDLLYFFFPFYSFFCLHKHYRWTIQIDKCGKFMRNKDSNSKDKAKQTWQMTSQKRKIRFLGKKFLKRLCFTYLTTDLRGTINTKNLNGEWIFFFIHINEARNWPSALVKSKIARQRNPNKFLEGFMKIRILHTV